MILEHIHQFLGNIVRTCNITQNYVDEDDPWSVILAAAAFVIRSTTNRMNGYSPVQLIFGRDMILLIKHTVYWELISHRKQTQINKYNIHENINQVDHDHKVGENACSINTLHTNMKLHIRAICDNTLFYQRRSQCTMWCDKN